MYERVGSRRSSSCIIKSVAIHSAPEEILIGTIFNASFWQQHPHRPHSAMLVCRCHLISPFPGSIALLCDCDCHFRSQNFLAPFHNSQFPPMEQPDNPPEVDAETLERAVWVVSNLPEDSLQLALDGVDPDNPVISAVRAMNNGTNGGTTDGTQNTNGVDLPPASMGPGNGGNVEEIEATGAGRTSNNSNSNSNFTPAQGRNPTRRRARTNARGHTSASASEIAHHSFAQNGQQDHQDQDHHRQVEQGYDDYLLNGFDDDDEDDEANNPNLNLNPDLNLDQYPAIPRTVTQEDEEHPDGGTDHPTHQEGRSNGTTTEEDEYDEDGVDKDGAEGEDEEEKKTDETEAVMVEDVLDEEEEEEEEDDLPDGGADRVRPTIDADAEAGALVVQEGGNINALVAAAAAAATTTGRRGVLHNTGVRAMLTMAGGGAATDVAVGVAVAQAAAEEKEAGILNTAAAREEGLRKAAAEREEGVRKAAAEREEGMRTAAAGREEIARLEEQLKAKEKDNQIALLQQKLQHQKETSKIEKEAWQREAETAKENFSNLVSQSSVKVPRNLSRTRPSMTDGTDLSQKFGDAVDSPAVTRPAVDNGTQAKTVHFGEAYSMASGSSGGDDGDDDNDGGDEATRKDPWPTAKDDGDVATSSVARAASPSEKDTVGGRSSFESFASVESPKKAGSKTTGLPMEQGTQSDDEDPNVQAAIATSLAAQVIAGAANAPDQSTAGYSSGSSIASLAEEKGTKTAGLSSDDDEEESESESSEDSTKDDDDDDDDGNSPGGATGSGLFVDSTGRRVQNDPEPNRPHSGTFIAIGDDGRAMRVDTNPNAEDSGSQTTRPRADSKAEESKDHDDEDEINGQDPIPPSKRGTGRPRKNLHFGDTPSPGSKPSREPRKRGGQRGTGSGAGARPDADSESSGDEIMCIDDSPDDGVDGVSGEEPDGEISDNVEVISISSNTVSDVDAVSDADASVESKSSEDESGGDLTETDGEDGDDDAFDGDAGGLFVNPTGPDGGATRTRTNPNPNDTAGTFLDRTTGRRLQNDPEPSRPRGSISIATGSDGRAMQVDNDPNNVGDETAVGRFTSTNIEDYQVGGRFHESLVGRRVRTKNHGTGTIVAISASGKTVKIQFDGDDAPHSTSFRASSIEEVLPH